MWGEPRLTAEHNEAGRLPRQGGRLEHTLGVAGNARLRRGIASSPAFLPAGPELFLPPRLDGVSQAREKKKNLTDPFATFFSARLCLWVAGNGPPWHLHPTALREGTPN